jgi:N-acetylmuramoyl-L-alanine amidase
MIMKKRIVLNVGHGGITGYYDSGAIAADGTHEHLFNKNEFCPLLKKELEKMGYEVITIIQNKSFGELPARINALKPDVIVSLHFNAFNGKATGSETLYYSLSRKSKSLAEKVQRETVKVLGLANRGAKGLLMGRGSALLIKTHAPCIILEPFFGDNPTDLARARERVAELATGVSVAIAEWFQG